MPTSAYRYVVHWHPNAGYVKLYGSNLAELSRPARADHRRSSGRCAGTTALSPSASLAAIMSISSRTARHYNATAHHRRRPECRPNSSARWVTETRRPRALQRQCPAIRAIRVAIPGLWPAKSLVTTMDGRHPASGKWRQSRLAQGPPSIRTENAQTRSTISMSISPAAIWRGYVNDARKAAVQDQVAPGPANNVEWSGQFEYPSARQPGCKPSSLATFSDLSSALSQLPTPDGVLIDRHALGAVLCAGSTALADAIRDGPQHECGRRRWFYRACWRRGRNRRRHADLSRQRP